MMNDWAGLPATYGDVLRRAMDSLFRTFENFSEGTFIVDAEARVVWINKRYAARFGFSDPGAGDRPGLRRGDSQQPDARGRETGKPILLDILETDREPLVVTRLPLKDDAGETVGAVGFALFDELKALTPLFSHYSRVQEELIATRQSLARARRANTRSAVLSARARPVSK
jgi:Transcriptional regulator containing PAS, AAA-type ATPase, and DNA-binding domains